MMQLQLLIDQQTHVTRLGAWIETVYPLSVTSIPAAFIVKEVSKHSPTRIGDRLSQAMIFEHSTHIEVLNLDVAKLIDEAMAGFVQKVFALVGDTLVLFCHLQAGLICTLASFGVWTTGAAIA